MQTRFSGARARAGLVVVCSLAALAPALARGQSGTGTTTARHGSARRAPAPKPTARTKAATTAAPANGPASIPQLAPRWTKNLRMNGVGTLVIVGLDSLQPGTVTLLLSFKDDGSHNNGKPRTSDIYATAPAAVWQAFANAAMQMMQGERFTCRSGNYVPGFGAPEAKVRIVQVIDGVLKAGPMPGTASMRCGEEGQYTLAAAATVPESEPSIGGDLTGQNVVVLAGLAALRQPPVSGLSGSR